MQIDSSSSPPLVHRIQSDGTLNASPAAVRKLSPSGCGYFRNRSAGRSRIASSTFGEGG